MSSLPEPQELIRALIPLWLSHSPDLPFVSFSRSPFCLVGLSRLPLTSIAGLGSCVVWLFASDPYFFHQCCSREAFPWSSKSGQLTWMASVHRATMPQTCCGGNGSSPKIKCHRPCLFYLGSLVAKVLILPREVLPHLRFSMYFIPICSLIAFHLI